jgi:hypothetical protein
MGIIERRIFSIIKIFNSQKVSLIYFNIHRRVCLYARVCVLCLRVRTRTTRPVKDDVTWLNQDTINIFIYIFIFIYIYIFIYKYNQHHKITELTAPGRRMHFLEEKYIPSLSICKKELFTIIIFNGIFHFDKQYDLYSRKTAAKVLD